MPNTIGTLVCDICGHSTSLEGKHWEYGEAKCKLCGQQYDYNEGQFPVLTDEQKKLLVRAAATTKQEEMRETVKTPHRVPPRHKEHAILKQLKSDIQKLSDGSQGSTLYSWKAISEIPGIECAELVGHKIYAAKLLDKNEITVYFVIFAWETEDDDTVWLNPFWYGEGTGGNLKELRHSFFGDDGYIFYADTQGFAVGAKWLAETFED